MDTGLLEVQFLGCGDAFSSGGRLQTCFLVRSANGRFLIDCGATVLTSMRRFGVDPNGISFILLSHLHGDHIGGLPIFILDARYVSKRTAPLLIAGPPGTRKRILEAMEVLYPGSSATEDKFSLEFQEMEPGSHHQFGGVGVTPYEVSHGSGAPPLALRVEVGGKVITYTGDTEWVEALIPAGKGADLLVTEASSFEKHIPFHLSVKTLRARLPGIGAKRVILTHMGPDTLAQLDSLEFETAEDGKIVEV